MDIKAGEEHVRSEARDWRERALKAQAEIKRLRGEIIKLQFQGGTVDRQALENNVRRGKKIASLQADNELLSKLNQEYGAEIEHLRAALAKSCEGGRDEMYDCGYNRLRAALERVANSTVLRAREIAREALEAGDE